MPTHFPLFSSWLSVQKHERDVNSDIEARMLPELAGECTCETRAEHAGVFHRSQQEVQCGVLQPGQAQHLFP